MIRLPIRTAVSAAALITLSACSSLLPPSPPPPTAHDFGPGIGGGPSYPAKQVSLNRIRMPDWLDDSEIHYRQVNQDPTAVKSYADNVWVASPATLLHQCLTQAGLTGHSADTKLELNLAINDFEQVITDKDRAHIEVVIDARLQDRKSGKTVAQRDFIDHRPVAANVQGAVKGLAKAGRQQCQAILDWLRQQQKPGRF